MDVLSNIHGFLTPKIVTKTLDNDKFNKNRGQNIRGKQARQREPQKAKESQGSRDIARKSQNVPRKAGKRPERARYHPRIFLRFLTGVFPEVFGEKGEDICLKSARESTKKKARGCQG